MNWTGVFLFAMLFMVICYDSKFLKWMSKDIQYILTFVFGALALLSELFKLTM